MVLKIEAYQLPQSLEFNYDELKAGLTEKVHVYETMIYGEDQIKQAKADRADLNRLKKALNDERLRREKEYMAPFNDFKTKINEIISIIDKPTAIIDQQIKEYEQKKKDEKLHQIEDMFAELGLPEYVTLNKVFDPAWLNSSVSLPRIGECMKDIVYKHDKDVAVLEGLPEFSFEALEYYKQDLDVAGALMKAQQLSNMARAKKAAEEEAARKAEEQRVAEEKRRALEAERAVQTAKNPGAPVQEAIEEPAEEGTWVKFEALLTTDQALALKSFFDNSHIAFRPIA